MTAMSIFPASRVLVPVDLTRASAEAWAWAKAVSAPGAALEAAYVRQLIPAAELGVPPPILSRAERASLERRLRAAYPGAAARVDEGDPVTVIERRARRADVVVMGSHRRTGLDRAIMGSVSEGVARDSPAPVLVARGPARRVRSALAPVNLEPYSRAGLALAADAAAFFEAELTILHVVRERRRSPNPMPFVESCLARLPAATRRALRPRVVRRVGDPRREILAEARRHGLVVLTAHRKSLLSDLVLGTTVERVLRYCPVPVLTAPGPRRA
jgi:nucleotide-binding universal stress UspA family protein